MNVLTRIFGAVARNRVASVAGAVALASLTALGMMNLEQANNVKEYHRCDTTEDSKTPDASPETPVHWIKAQDGKPARVLEVSYSMFYNENEDQCHYFDRNIMVKVKREEWNGKPVYRHPHHLALLENYTP